ncbi:hypothetical protein BGP76_04965 [Reichenbachiella sp. MSK19-1]|nr:hypothetical protein BGP76_04965 [Reichenbachiella sp. MSK19-1]
MGQDTLVLKSGKRIPFTRMVTYEDVVQVKDYNIKEMIDVLPDSIIGYSQAKKDEDYFMIFPPETGSYLFVERLMTGSITLYLDQYGGYVLYAKKNDELFELYDAHDNKREREEKLKTLKTLVADDAESYGYVSAPGFKLKNKEIQKVLYHYNERNYVERTPTADDVVGTVYLYRTQFQKTKNRVRVVLFGETHDLYIRDYIQLNIPIEYASRMLIYDRDIKSDLLITGELEDQYYELLYDGQKDEFVLEPKNGTEQHYEFYGIKEQVGEKMSGD